MLHACVKPLQCGNYVLLKFFVTINRGDSYCAGHRVECVQFVGLAECVPFTL